MSEQNNTSVKLVAVGSLSLWDKNPRTINPLKLENLKKSIQADPDFLRLRPVLADKNGVIYAGNQRYKAAVELGMTEVYAVVEDVEESVMISRALKDNSQWGDWDTEKLPELIFSLPEIDQTLTGFSENNLKKMLDEMNLAAGEGDLKPVFTDEQIVDLAVAYFMKAGFPYPKLTVHECMQQINKLAMTDTPTLRQYNYGGDIADSYHPHRFSAGVKNMLSLVDLFKDPEALKKSFLFTLREKSVIKTTLTSEVGIASRVQECANFRPGFALYLYRQYCKAGDTILDTSTGYGGRLVAFMASHAGKYIGIDPNVPTHEANLKMAADLGFSDRVVLHNLPAEEVPHDAVRGQCDFSFTSPPYFSKEHYSEDKTQSHVKFPSAEGWRDGFLKPMMDLTFAALKPGKFALVNISDVRIKSEIIPLEQWTVESGIAAGFEFVKKEEFPIPRRPYAQMNEKEKHEPVFLFRKSA